MRTTKPDHTQTAEWLAAFLVWPLASFLASFKHLGSRMFSILLVSFYFLYGYTYVISGKDQDTFRTSNYFIESTRLTFGDLLNKLSNVYTIGSKPDVFQDVLQFVVSRFTNDVQVYFAITAVIFALFTARTFEIVFKNLKTNPSVFSPFILACAIFLLLVFIPSRINSFRHYLATAIFISFIYSYLTEGGIKNLLFLLATPLIHFGFTLVLPFVLLYFLIGRYVWLCYIPVALSFVLSADSITFLQQYISELDQNAFQYHANAYTSDVYLGQVRELKVQRYFILDTYIYYTSLFFFALTLYHGRFFKEMDKGTARLYVFSLLIFSFVNFFSELESVANRFGVLYHGLCCVFLIRFYKLSERPIPRAVLFLFYAVLLVNAVIVLRIFIQSASVSILLLLYPVSILSPMSTSILDWLRGA